MGPVESEVEVERVDLDKPPDLRSFFEDVQTVKEAFARIEENLEEMEELHDRNLKCSIPKEQTRLKDEIKELLDNTNNQVANAQRILKRMDEENKSCEGGVGEKRMRESHFSTLASKLVDLTGKVQELDARALSRYRKKLRGEMEVALPDATEEQIEEYVQKGQSNIFSEELMQHSASGQTILVTHAMAVEKYRDLLQLENSMDELMEMIRDFSNMVFMQGPVVDMISKNVSQASNYVAKGVVELQKARKYQTKSRKKMMMIICILVIVAVVIIVLGSSLGIAL